LKPGFGGQKYIPESTAKIKEIKDNAPQGLIIEVDGGINDLTAKEAVNAGQMHLWQEHMSIIPKILHQQSKNFADNHP
jgi:pentose-5-phosphate-3-epimerase